MELPGPIVFFGTPAFAVPTLEALCEAGWAPALVVTQPARAVGRGRKVSEPPVAHRARELGLPVELVASVREDLFQQRLAAHRPWVGIVVAFGQIFPSALLELPAAGCVNLHASLLPRFRGAAPIQAAIVAGESITGVTTMRMTAGLDAGPILVQEKVGIGDDETAPELAQRLAAIGAGLVVLTLERLATGDLNGVEQDEELATFAPKLGRQDGAVDWQLTSVELFNRWRAFTPWPGLTAILAGETVKIRRCRPAPDRTHDRRPGEILAVGADLEVACGSATTLRLEALQRPNKGVLEAREFVNGEHLTVGDRFEQAVAS